MDVDDMVRLAAVEGLARIPPSDETIAALVELALHDPNEDVRQAALDGLASVSDLPAEIRTLASTASTEE